MSVVEGHIILTLSGPGFLRLACPGGEGRADSATRAKRTKFQNAIKLF